LTGPKESSPSNKDSKLSGPVQDIDIPAGGVSGDENPFDVINDDIMEDLLAGGDNLLEND